MAVLDITAKTLKRLIKEELDESTDSEFPDFMLALTTSIIKDWGQNLDYVKLKKLQKEVTNLLKEFDGDSDEN